MTGTGTVTQAPDVPDTAGWTASGLAAVSGPVPGGRTGPPSLLMPGVVSLGRRIETASGRIGAAIQQDWAALLTERARLEGLSARGRISCGGASRLLACADGWFALTLARATDRELVPAWLALAGAGPSVSGQIDAEQPDEELWATIGSATLTCRGASLSDAAAVVGLPVGVLGEAARRGGDGEVDGVAITWFGPTRRTDSVRVVDLSALWAGPLCGALLAAAGADVVKVESAGRPDTSRTGSAALFDRLNGGKQQLVLDLDLASGRAELARLVRRADIVIESSRPRALEQLGIVAADELAHPDGPRAWVSITGHGRRAGRVAFGDDAAVAGGLVVSDQDGPWFCGDAIADPLSGLMAAAAVFELLAENRRALVDVAMAGVAAAHAGPTLPTL